MKLVKKTKAEAQSREKQSTINDLENTLHQLDEKNQSLDKTTKKNKGLQEDLQNKLEELAKAINKGNKNLKKNGRRCI